MIKIELTEEQYDQLLTELHSLYNYHYKDDHIHADDCGSKVVSEIESQGDEQKANRIY